MDQKEENEEAVIKWDCHCNSSLYDTYEVVAIGSKIDSHIMKFPFFGSSRRLSFSMASATNAGLSSSSSGKFPLMHSASEKSTMSKKVSSFMVKFWIKIVEKNGRRKKKKLEGKKRGKA